MRSRIGLRQAGFISIAQSGEPSGRIRGREHPIKRKSDREARPSRPTAGRAASAREIQLPHSLTSRACTANIAREVLECLLLEL
jgi:hypothetical protein